MIRKRLGLPIPVEPENDGITSTLLELFYLADRSRRFVEYSPLPLSVPEIKACMDVMALDGLSEREVFNAMFELDRIRLERWRRK